MAVRDHRARTLYQLPEQRRFSARGMPGLVTMELLALVLFLGGLVIGPASMTRNQAVPGVPPTSAPACSTALAEGAATSRVGPRRFEHEVGVGYARSQQGAVAAATNYTSVLSSDLVLDEVRRRTPIDTLAASEARAGLKTFDQAVVSLRKMLMRAHPVGSKVDDYGDGTARVAIWVSDVAGSIGGADGSAPIREGWGMTTVDLRWVGGDWKQCDSTTVEGALPLTDTVTPTAASLLIPKAQEFKESTYASGP